MEFQNSKFRWRPIWVVYSITFLFFIVIATIAPIRKLSQVNKIVEADSVFYQKNKWVLKDEKAADQFIKKAFIDAQIELASVDSIGFVINLKDSTAALVINGVSIHVSKIGKMKVDRFFKALNPLVYAELFSKPLYIITERTSIVKEPIVLHKAPKDTIEAMATAYVPQMPKQNPACFEMQLPNDLTVLLVQNELTTKEDRAVVKEYRASLRKRKTRDNFKSIVHLKRFFYSPSIIIWLDGDEIRSIYRALPNQPAIVLYY